MEDWKIHASATCAAAAGLWVLALGVWLTSWLLHRPALGDLSILLGIGAGVGMVRSYFVAQSERIKTALVVTGRVKSDGASVRPMR